jgi:hypothetical protein
MTTGLRIADEVAALDNHQSAFLDSMTRAVNKYLDRNARRWVDMNSLFSFMKL